MTDLLTDIGGTYMRVAQAAGRDFIAPEKYAVADFESLPAILNAYCAYKNLPAGGSVRIATAANPAPDGIWRFTNNATRNIDPAIFRTGGWDVTTLMDDFMASAHGVDRVDTAHRHILRDGPGMRGAPRAILGPGTGLGLAYLIALPDGRRHVQQTFGGHMLAAVATAEQRQILDIVAGLKTDGAIVVPEDVASGRGLSLLHRAVRTMRNGPDEHITLAGLLKDTSPAAVTTLRLFHEFLGLFAHHALVTFHAYGGLYLDGGVLHALRHHNRFDFPSFIKYVDLAAASVVHEALTQTPVFMIDDPYIALRGLIACSREGKAA